MNPLHAALIARLTGDATLLAVLTGGVFGRALKATGPGNTSTAWAVNAATGIAYLRPCAVILDPGEVMHPSGNRDPDIHAYDAWARLFLYAPATDSGKTAIVTADSRAIALFHQWTATLAGVGTAQVVAMPERLGTLDSDEFPGVVFSVRRFRASGTRQIVRAA